MKIAADDSGRVLDLPPRHPHALRRDHDGRSVALEFHHLQDDALHDYVAGYG